MSYKNWTKYALRFDSYYDNNRFYNILRKKGIEFRMRTVCDLIGDLKNMRIIDIGCGAGRLSIELAMSGAEVWGVDIAADAIKQANINAKNAGVESHVHFIQGDLYGDSISLPPADVWVALGFLEYLEEPSIVLRKVSHIPKYVFSIPIKMSWEIPLRVINRRLLKGTRFYTYTKKTTTAMLNGAGYVDVNFIPYFRAGYMVHNYQS
jgi:2-polyprenyl-3-methyl-5-hydroxy-6-metoxy-1,4-benzoquinol methylase